MAPKQEMNLTGLKLSDLGQAQQVLYGTNGAFRRNDLTSDSETEDDASFISSFTQSFQSIQSTANDDGYSTDSTMCSTNMILTHLTKEIANLQSMTTGSFVVDRTTLSTLMQDNQQKSTRLKELEKQMKEYAKKKERKKRRKHKSSSSSSKRKKKSSRHSSKSKSSDKKNKKKSSSSRRHHKSSSSSKRRSSKHSRSDRKKSKSGSKHNQAGEETDVSMLNQGPDSSEYETEADPRHAAEDSAVEESPVDGGTNLYYLNKKEGTSSSKQDSTPEDSAVEESSIGSGTNLAALGNKSSSKKKREKKEKKHKKHKKHKNKKRKSTRRSVDAPSLADDFEIARAYGSNSSTEESDLDDYIPKQRRPSGLRSQELKDSFRIEPSDLPRRKVVKTRSVCVPVRPLKELKTEFEPAVFKKNKTEKEMIKKELRQNTFFQQLEEDTIEQLIMAFEVSQTYNPEEIIVNEGDRGEYFCIVKSGNVGYSVDGQQFGSAEKGDSFGGLSLMYAFSCQVTVTASSQTQLYRLDQKTFRYIVQSYAKFQRPRKSGFNKGKGANRFGRLSMLARMVPAKQYEKIDDEADDDDDLFNLDEAGLDLEKVQQTREKEHEFIRSDRVSLKSFNRAPVLGEGQFGEVWNVKLDFDPEEFESFDLEDWDEQALRDANYALKIQSKTDKSRLVEDSELSPVDAVKRECDVLKKLTHPFIVRLINHFEDDENIYMLTEVVNGNELWDVIHRKDESGGWRSGISEADTKFYNLMIVDTLNYIHRQKIVHRDLKPQVRNILLRFFLPWFL